MESKRKEKGHWFNVLIFFLPLWAMLSAYNWYSSIMKLIEWYQRHEVLSLPLLLISQVPTLFFVFAFVIAPVILTYLLFKRKSYKLCKILSIVVAIGLPWGTVLGIFSFILLRREPIKAEFNDSNYSIENSDANKALNTDG